MSCAEVCIDMGHDGWNEFHHARTPQARVGHRCCECGRTIKPGERYEYVSGKSEGEIWTAKTCLTCVEIRKALVCGSWIYGELWVAIREDVFPAWEHTGPWDCLAKIEDKAARRELLRRYREWRRDFGLPPAPEGE